MKRFRIWHSTDTDAQRLEALMAVMKQEADDTARYHRRYLHGPRQPSRACPACPAERMEHDGWGAARTGCQLSIALLPGGRNE